MIKWIIVSLSIWGDGAYTFMPDRLSSPAYFSSEEECLRFLPAPMPGLRQSGQPPEFTTHICLPEDAWRNFAMRRPRL